MKTKVSKLPKHAVYDYTDLFGIKHYHTARRCYDVVRKTHFGKTEVRIYSRKREED